MKNLFMFFCLVLSLSASGQITALNYLLHYNCDNNLYEVRIKILEGNAMEVSERVQFNSQISILVPTGLDFEIVELNNPIENNQLYDGTSPCEWKVFPPVVSPVEQPENDFYSISPQLSPASFFNDLNVGDEVTLFQCKIGDSNEYNQDVRFYDNDLDPQISSSGSDFRNGFAIGSPNQTYVANEYSSCLTNVFEADINSSVYPNPFEDRLIIEMDEIPSYLSLTNMDGIIIHEVLSPSNNMIEITTSNLPTGMYILNYIDKVGKHKHKVVKR